MVIKFFIPMDTKTHATTIWARNIHLEPIHIDCITAIMLKILDGKCKMNAQEKQVMTIVYDVVKKRQGKLLDDSIHRLIATAREQAMDEQLVEKVYEQRLYAEQMISRPVMKGFKAMLREQGILPNKA